MCAIRLGSDLHAIEGWHVDTGDTDRGLSGVAAIFDRCTTTTVGVGRRSFSFGDDGDER
jgi:hypothetical protein